MDLLLSKIYCKAALKVVEDLGEERLPEPEQPVVPLSVSVKSDENQPTADEIDHTQALPKLSEEQEAGLCPPEPRAPASSAPTPGTPSIPFN
jgi:Lon-like ATP-dependent protease